MNDQDLCDWLVEAGILVESCGYYHRSRPGVDVEYLTETSEDWRTEAETVLEWDVAGACLERMWPRWPSISFTHASMPRAIIEAMYRAEVGGE